MKQFIAITAIGIATSLTVFAGVIALADSSDSGKEVYEENCSACHGDDGKGAFPGITPDFTSKKGPLSKSDKVLIKHITDGYESEGSQMEMPALGGNDELSDEDVKKVLEYIRENFQPK